MKPTHLITLSARVEEINKAQEKILNKNEELNRLWKPLISLCWRGAFDLIVYWESFIKQIVNLAHFVRCDANGVPLEKFKEPTYSVHAEVAADENAIYSDALIDYCDDLREAQKSVIFEGWEVLDYCNRGLDVIIGNGYLMIYFYSTVNGTIVRFGHRKKAAFNISTLADLAEATTENPLKLK